MADFITNDVSLDRHGRRDGWFIEPSGSRPSLFLSNEELDALVAWKTGTGIWSPIEPMSIDDMAPGTTFRITEDDEIWTVQDNRVAVCSTHGVGRYLDVFDPNSITDVVPPTKETR